MLIHKGDAVIAEDQQPMPSPFAVAYQAEAPGALKSAQDGSFQGLFYSQDSV